MTWLNGTVSTVASSFDVSPHIDTPYNYVPTEGIAITFVVLFSLSTALHLAAAVRFRLWWLLPTAVLAGIGETLGWAGRLWSSINVNSDDAFMIQICCTIVSPTFLLAAIFIIFARLSRQLGACYGRLPPKWYAWIFLTCDTVALIAQGTGGGVASSADTPEGANRGGNIMLGGIVFQLAALVLFMLLATEFFFRSATDRPIRSRSSNDSDSVATLYHGVPIWTTRLKAMSVAIGLMALLLLIRSIYRTIELADGWNGRIISTEVYFNVLDGAMVLIATYTLNIFHPGYLLYDAHSRPLAGTENLEKSGERV